MDFVPIKVRWTFGAPVLVESEYPIHLDALIAASVAREAEALGDPDPWRTADDLSNYLESAGSGDAMVWKASALRFTPMIRADALIDGMNTVRRSDPEKWYDDFGAGYWQASRAGDPPTINTQSGVLRGYQWIARTRWMDRAEAWAVGDLDAVSDALSRVRFIGKAGRNGFGRVRSVEVLPAEPGEAGNWMLRVLPPGMPGAPGVEYAPVMACLRAPYWRRTARVPALEPVTA